MIMIRVFILILLLFVVNFMMHKSLMAQPLVSFDKAALGNNYKKISRWQKTAIVLAAGGGLMVVTGWAIPRGKPLERYPDCILECKNRNDDLKSVLVIGGVASLLSSIPLFVISSKFGESAVYVRPHINKRFKGKPEENRTYPEIMLRLKF
jgi:hypothetical protein